MIKLLLLTLILCFPKISLDEISFDILSAKNKSEISNYLFASGSQLEHKTIKKKTGLIDDNLYLDQFSIVLEFLKPNKLIQSDSPDLFHFFAINSPARGPPHFRI